MSQHTFGGALVGVVAILLGVAWLAAAVGRLRRAGRMSTELGQSASGVYTYTLAQVGCGGALVVAGLVVVALVILR